MQPTYLLDEIDSEVGDEEREQEPCGPVAVEAAGLPDVFPGQGLNGLMVSVEQEGQEGKVDGHSNQTGREVGDEDASGAVRDVVHRALAFQTLVEVARLEEEKGHEVETPLHDMRPPFNLSQAAEVHDVQADHANDAKAAQEVEHMISFFHSAKVQKKV